MLRIEIVKLIRESRLGVLCSTNIDQEQRASGRYYKQRKQYMYEFDSVVISLTWQKALAAATISNTNNTSMIVHLDW